MALRFQPVVGKKYRKLVLNPITVRNILPVAYERPFVRPINLEGLDEKTALDIKFLLVRHAGFYVDDAANRVAAILSREGAVNDIDGIDLVRTDQRPARRTVEGCLQKIVQRQAVGINHVARGREHIRAADAQNTIGIAYVALADLQAGHVLEDFFRGLRILPFDLSPRHACRGGSKVRIPLRLPGDNHFLEDGFLLNYRRIIFLLLAALVPPIPLVLLVPLILSILTWLVANIR